MVGGLNSVLLSRLLQEPGRFAASTADDVTGFSAVRYMCNPLGISLIASSDLHFRFHRCDFTSTGVPSRFFSI